MNPQNYEVRISEDVYLETDGCNLVIVKDTGEYRKPRIYLSKEQALKLMSTILTWSNIAFENKQ